MLGRGLVPVCSVNDVTPDVTQLEWDYKAEVPGTPSKSSYHAVKKVHIVSSIPRLIKLFIRSDGLELSDVCCFIGVVL